MIPRTVADNTPIQEISERLADLVRALQQAGASDDARRIQRFERQFRDVARVRRAVQGLQDQLHEWRDHPEKLPEAPTVHVAANVLEDECRKALKGGVIVAAPPTLADHARRKLRVSLIGGGLALLIGAAAFTLQFVGVDLSNPMQHPEIRRVELPQGGERVVTLLAMSPSVEAKHVQGVSFELLDGCEGEEHYGVSCSPSPEPRMWTSGRLPTFEAKLTHQAYGVLFAFADEQIAQGRGYGRLLLAATNDTPQGDYLVQLKAAYLGYRPVECSIVQRMLGECPGSIVQKSARHGGIEVPPIIVVVGPPSEKDRLAAKQRAQRIADEKREAAEERAGRIAAVSAEIEAALRDNARALKRRRYAEAREMIGKLAVLFEPLDLLLADPAASGSVPQVVIDIRERFSEQRTALSAFEDEVFDQLFERLHSDEASGKANGDEVMARIAKKRKMPVEYVEEIYADHAEALQKRLKQQAQARLDAKKEYESNLRERCGDLEGGGWKAIETFLKAKLENEHVAVKLGECMSPLLTENCWEVGCDYAKRVTIDALHPSKTREFQARFHIRNNAVLGYVPKRGGKRAGSPARARP